MSCFAVRVETGHGPPLVTVHTPRVHTRRPFAPQWYVHASESGAQGVPSLGAAAGQAGLELGASQCHVGFKVQ